jgi:hypothetical protein
MNKKKLLDMKNPLSDPKFKANYEKIKAQD